MVDAPAKGRDVGGGGGGEARCGRGGEVDEDLPPVRRKGFTVRRARCVKVC